jgi:hypothetical protein
MVRVLRRLRSACEGFSQVYSIKKPVGNGSRATRRKPLWRAAEMITPLNALGCANGLLNSEDIRYQIATVNDA